MRKILALDMSSKTGWAVIHSDFRVASEPLYRASGVWQFKGNRVKRAVLFREALTTVTAMYGPFDAVMYERPFARGRDATRSLWGMAGMVESTFGDKAAVLDTEVNTLKKWAAEWRGLRFAQRTGKAHTLEVARRILGREPIDDNEADAVCLGWYTAEKMEVE